MDAAHINRETILSVLRKQKELLRNKYFVKHIGLFDSFAKNEATAKSDIDFIVDFKEGDLDYYTIRRELHDFFILEFDREIDIAIAKSIKPFYREMIFKDVIYA